MDCEIGYKYKFLVLTILIGVSNLVSADKSSSDVVITALTDYLPSQETYPVDGVVVGQGWFRSIGRKSLNRCVTGETIPIAGGASTVKYQEIFDREELATSLKISASGSYGSFSGSSSFSRETGLDKSKRNILVTINVEKGGFQLAPSAPSSQVASIQKGSFLPMYHTVFTPEAKKILMDDDLSPKERLGAFKALCGDSFVSAIRTGGQYVAIFSFSHTLESLRQSFESSASGGGSGFSGSGSISSSLARSSTLDNTSINTMQIGGDLSVPLTAKEAYDKIKTFGGFKSEESIPYSVVIVPYQYVHEWPVELNNLIISDWQLQVLLGQMWRLADLSNVYADASLNPIKYYYPFQFSDKPTEETAKAATSLRLASVCLERFISSCIFDKGCNFASETPESLMSYCPSEGEDQNLVDYMSDSLALAFPSRVIDQVASNSNVKQVLKSAKIISDSGFKYAPSVPSKTLNKSSDLASGPFALYYKYYASAPLRRLGSDLPGDEAYQVQIFCEINNPGRAICNDAKRSQLNVIPVGDALKGVQEIYSQWVSAVRLNKISESYCNVSSRHPMCRDPSELINWGGDLIAVFGESRGYLKDKSEPLPKKKPDPTPRYVRECDWRICK